MSKSFVIRMVCKLTFSAMLALCSVGAMAQVASWPDRPIRLILPYTPGSLTDTIARMLAERLTQRLGKPVIVENRAGATTIIGTEAVARATPDGYTLFLGGSSTHTVGPNLIKSLPYDPIKDFAEVAYVGGIRSYLVVGGSSPYRTVAELLASAKATPGKLNYAAVTPTAILAAELFKLVTGTEFIQINYKSSPQAITDIIGGQVHMGIVVPGDAAALMKSGQLRALAYTGLTRSEAFPQVATFGELGFPELQKIVGWFGLWYPAKTPQAIVERMNREVNAVLAQPDFVQKFVSFGVTLDGTGGTPEEFGKLIREDLVRWARVVKEANIPRQ